MFSTKIKAKTLRNILLPGKRTFSSQDKYSLRHKEKKVLVPQTKCAALGYCAILFHYVCSKA